MAMRQLRLLDTPEARAADDGDVGAIEHVALLDEHARVATNGKTAVVRANGQFYTHEVIGRHLARAVASRVKDRSVLRIIDPFCGDGRLIAWLLDEADLGDRCTLHISLWEIDATVLQEAASLVDATARRLGRRIKLDVFQGDTFQRAPDAEGSYDVVLTNPPWELLKPDRREVAHLPADLVDAYVSALRDFDMRLQAAYPDAQPLRRFAGWGTNLARVGTDVSIQLLAADGVCGVVSPSSLFADSNSVQLRRRIFDELDVQEIAYFPAEARLFEHVDVPCVAFVAKRRSRTPIAPVLTRFSSARTVEDTQRVRFHRSALADDGFVLPVAFGAVGAAVLNELRALPRFADLEDDGMWCGRELDETRKERYLSPEGEYAFVKGVNIRRFGFARPTVSFVDPARASIPPTVRHPRLAWRDVSRPTQKRRVQATLIPSGWVAGNSLGVACFPSGSLIRLAALLAIFSSIPFEYQLRSRLSTGHVSLASVRQVRTPALTDKLIDRMGPLAVAALEGEQAAEYRLEAEAARAYGLDREAWRLMLSEFPKLSPEETSSLVGAWDS